MAEGTPVPIEETLRLHRNLIDSILDRAASDPQWKQQLVDDPEAALQMADFPELRAFAELQRQKSEIPLEEAETSGQYLSLGGQQQTFRLPCWFTTFYYT